jgi:hypothetical protein
MEYNSNQPNPYNNHYTNDFNDDSLEHYRL